MVPYHRWICKYDILKRTGGAYEFGRDFTVIIWEGQATKGWGYFYRESWLLETPCKDFNLAIGGLVGRGKLSKSGIGEGFMFRIIIPALYLFWRKFYRRKLGFQHVWILIVKKQNTNQKCESWKGGGISQILLIITITSLIFVTFSAVQ